MTRVTRAVELFARADVARSTRLHTRLRWWWCPFAAIEGAVPRRGDVLEVGCGHGLLTLHLALSAADRAVTGVDIDGAKIAEANAAAARLQPSEATVSFETVPPGYLPSPEAGWDAVVIADVLYLLPAEVQRAVVEAAARAVRVGGAVVIKEMALTPRWKLAWNRAQETLATKVFSVTQSANHDLVFVAPDDMAQWLLDAGLDVESRRLDRGYPWPHHLLVGRAATSARASVG